MAPKVRDYLTIGEVVEKLSAEHPDLSISKVRFLEDERLISPERTAGGYRKYRQADVHRLELILALQRDNFMPLAVIREKLEDLDKGKLPPELKPAMGRAEAMSLPLDDAETVPLDRVPDVLGLPSAFVEELASFGIVSLVEG
ncbi:MAG: MerR family transcriptional regulator, partial [Coriobacteriia bacterium]|nr:MerR family transcriptional regulator [Coriobacteriia bacterium]